MYKHIRPWAWWYKSLMLRKPLHKMRVQNDNRRVLWTSP